MKSDFVTEPRLRHFPDYRVFMADNSFLLKLKDKKVVVNEKG
jgi:hypothetical protein